MRILLAEDVHMVRDAFVALLDLQPDFEVVAKTERGDTVVPAALDHRPDVAILDANLPGIDGLAAARLLRRHLPQCRTVIITASQPNGLLARCLNEGVSGLVLKVASAECLTQAVRGVAAGLRVIDSQIALNEFEHQTAGPLSPREIDVLRYTSKGNSVKEIAEVLFLSTGTVRNYLTSINSKLNARTKVDAVLIAQDAGWID
ncbi:MAG TPA: response regulator transcription factor [Actinocrinis sp.]|nr:response regulator transcription factor [Actinocrinis sp.]